MEEAIQGGTERELQGAAVNTKERGSPRGFYECNLCKRGFSNAQALGGHMNIHRKTRAPNSKVMRHSSCDQSGDSAAVHVTNLMGPPHFYDWPGFITGHPWVHPRDHHAAAYSSMQLPSLFGLPQPSESSHGWQQEAAELDLELRLGPR